MTKWLDLSSPKKENVFRVEDRGGKNFCRKYAMMAWPDGVQLAQIYFLIVTTAVVSRDLWHAFTDLTDDVIGKLMNTSKSIDAGVRIGDLLQRNIWLRFLALNKFKSLTRY